MDKFKFAICHPPDDSKDFEVLVEDFIDYKTVRCLTENNHILAISLDFLEFLDEDRENIKLISKVLKKEEQWTLNSTKIWREKRKNKKWKKYECF